MRTRVTTSPAPVEDLAVPDQDWLDMEPGAQVELTSEDSAHGTETARVAGEESGWRAAQPGEQTVRLFVAVSMIFVYGERLSQSSS